MKIHVLGGGPAGLYFALLAKKANPGASIRVLERNAADDTFGWGVVFSDETLGNLDEADAPTHRAIREQFAYWDAIDCHVDVARKGGSKTTKATAVEPIRSGGHGFCGIGRMRLLLLLQARARELGVELIFNHEVDDVEALRGDCDLLVAADGINSKTRATYADFFEPTTVEGKSPFIWLGTHQSFEAFTFIFRENEHGVFNVHAYQFDAGDGERPGTSTFIVETDEDTWRRSGLHEADEARSLQYCQELFAPELGGNALLANRSSWIRFRTLHCQRWAHENVVLVGDAAHTAHFSVGSGTKMAMEDSIALAHALSAHRTDLQAALAAYADDRQQTTARVQKAASQSQQWFEQSARHVRGDPQQVMFSMLTRTRRVTHENLRLRDSQYVREVDEWFMKEAAATAAPSVKGGGHDSSGSPTPPMFTPLTLRGMELCNRVVVSPMCQYSATEGVPNEWHLVHLGSRALGGAGLVFAEMTNVSATGRITPGCTGLWNEQQQDAWTRIVDFVHARSPAKIGLQLGHAGRKGATKLMWEGMDAPLGQGAWETLAPSALPWSPNNVAPREMTRADMVTVRDEFVAAARRALAAGFDLLEVHFAHGYLLSSFLTPLSNLRADAYGGDLRGRARYPLEVFEAVRQVWSHRPLSVRISATDWVPGGFAIEDAIELSSMLKDRGVDLIDVSAGQTSPEARPIYGRAFQTPFSERIRNEVGVATMAVGNILDHDRVNTILAAGRADLVALARAHLANPNFTLHAAVELGYEAQSWPVQYRAAGSVASRMLPVDE